MNRILKFPLSIILLFTVFSCNSELAVENDAENKALIDVLNTNDNEILSLKGDFQFFKSDRDQLIIFTETKDIKHAFYLNGVGDFSISKIRENKIEKIKYLQHGVLLSDHIFVGVKGNVDPKVKQLIISDSDNIKIEEYFVDNLLHVWLSKESKDFDKFNFKDLTSDNNLKEYFSKSAHSDDCNVGGEGSTGCNITSHGGSGCSVSCGTGYYACCNETTYGPNDCHCHKYDTLK